MISLPRLSLQTAQRTALGLLTAVLPALSAGAATLPAGFTETLLASGLNSPTAMAIAPDGRVFVCQQSGQLRVVTAAGTLLGTPFLTVTVNSTGERGLLGVAFDPAFTTNRFIYVYYTATSPNIHNRVSRFTASAANPNVVEAGSEVRLFDLPALSSATNHNGGALHFGQDGKLYIAVGENATGSNAQSTNTTLGKMLRINKEPSGTAGVPSIPSDNPFFGQLAGNNRAIWALGLRNPFTFGIQRGTGRIHINDVGQNTWEEVNLGQAGRNYGWPACEGPHNNGAGTCPNPSANFTAPIFAYQQGTANCAIVGGAFYNPPTVQFPSAFVNRFFYADLCGGFIRFLNPPGYTTSSPFATGVSSPVDLAVGNDGMLYYLARGGGQLFRIRSTQTQAPQITQHPQSRTVAVGQSVTFTVAATGTAPLSFQWERNDQPITGATSSSFTIASATLNDNQDTFRAVVSNDFGEATSNSATLTVTDNQPPVGTINTPAAGSLFSGGQTIQFTGSATDPEDGALGAAAFTWRVDLHHEVHTHPHMQPVSGITSGSFVTADRGHPDTNTFYRIVLTVRDSDGLTHTTTRDVQPRTSTITLATQPAGLQVTLDGQPVTTPVSVGSVEGVFRTLGVVSPQTSGGSTFTFVSWSDGGAATHEIRTPVADTTFTATYQTSNVTTVFSDGFGQNLGWVNNVGGTDTATTGQWQRGNPAATSSGGAAMQLENCNAGTPNCLITGLSAGTSVGSFDVDGGVASISSPNITLPASGTITLSFAYYFAHLNNSSSADFFRVRIGNTMVFEELGTAATDAAVWVTRSVNISAFAGQTIRIRIEAADAATGSLVEAGVDDVRVTVQQ